MARETKAEREFRLAREEAEEVRGLTLAEAKALPGLLGFLADANMRLGKGWYGYRDIRHRADGSEYEVKVLLVQASH